MGYKQSYYMFSDCSSLISLPDISKWDTNNASKMHEMFYECPALIYIPNLSKKI